MCDRCRRLGLVCVVGEGFRACQVCRGNRKTCEVDRVPINRTRGRAAVAEPQAKSRKRKAADPGRPQALGVDGSERARKRWRVDEDASCRAKMDEDASCQAMMDERGLDFILDEQGRTGVRDGDGLLWLPAVEPQVRAELSDRERIAELEREHARLRSLVIAMAERMWMARGSRG